MRTIPFRSFLFGHLIASSTVAPLFIWTSHVRVLWGELMPTLAFGLRLVDARLRQRTGMEIGRSRFGLEVIRIAATVMWACVEVIAQAKGCRLIVAFVPNVHPLRNRTYQQLVRYTVGVDALSLMLNRTVAIYPTAFSPRPAGAVCGRLDTFPELVL
jgi:hypothetical protein